MITLRHSGERQNPFLFERSENSSQQLHYHGGIDNLNELLKRIIKGQR